MGRGDVRRPRALRRDQGRPRASTRDNPATPAPGDPARKAKIDAFVAKQDIDEAALLEVVGDIKATVDTILDFIDAVKADAVDPWTLFWLIFKVFALDMLRVRNPSRLCPRPRGRAS